jgi:hypothetical protein
MHLQEIQFNPEQAGHLASTIGDIYTNPRVSQGELVNTSLSIKHPDTNIAITSSNMEAYDSDVGEVKEVDFDMSLSLRPETSYQEHLHTWRYSEYAIRHFLFKEEYNTQEEYTFYQWYWTYLSPQKYMQLGSRNMTSGWSVKNVYALNTIQFKVQIGAYYDPQPIFPSDITTFGDLNKDNGKSIFPDILTTSEAVNWIFDSWWVIVIILSLIAIVIVVYVKRDIFGL